jgi:hypothetical protein
MASSEIKLFNVVTRGLGDLLLVTPALRALKHRYRKRSKHLLAILTVAFDKPQQTAYPRHQFLWRERLGHIVVGAQVQSLDAIAFLRPGRQEDNGRFELVSRSSPSQVGRRLEMSGMFWTVRGPNSIIALRCNRIRGKSADYWESRAA